MRHVATIIVKDEVNVRIKGLDPDLIDETQDRLTFFVPGYIHMPSYKLGRWDGKIRLLSKTGTTYLNLLEYVIPMIEEAGYDIVFEDNRADWSGVTDVIKEIDSNYLSNCMFNGKPLVLRDYQIEGINKAIIEGGGILEMATGSGKAQPLDSMVHTPNGWKRMGDIIIGDIVSSYNGPTQVVGVFPQGVKEVFEIEFSDGRKTRACGDHLWYVWNKHWRNNRGTGGEITLESCKIKTTSEILHILEDTNVPLYIPLVTVEQDDIKLPMDSYLLGALLGDGTFRHTLGFSSADDFIIETIASKLDEDYEVRKQSYYDYGIRHIGGTEHKHQYPGVPINRYKDILQDLGLWGKYSYEKSIPDIYKLGSVEQRLELIRGLMDTDGHVCKKGSLSYSTSSINLAKDMTDVLRSVGAIVTMSTKTTTHRDNYILNISHTEPDSLVSLPRKMDRAKNNTWRRGKLKLRIKSITSVSHEECQCIKVEDSSESYVTDGYVLTHNTLVCATLSKVYSEFGYVVVIVPNIDLVLQTQHTFKQIGLETGLWYGGIKERKQITIATWQSLDHFPELFAGVSCVIVDEVHQAKAKILNEMLTGPACNVPFRFGCTGTLPKEELFRLQIEGSLGKEIFILRTWQLQNEGVLANTNIYQVQLNDAENADYIKRTSKFSFEDWNDELSWLLEHKKRLNYIANLLSEVRDNSGNTLVLVPFRKHGKSLQELIPNSMSLDGRDKNRLDKYKKFNDSDDNIMICTYGIASTGIDIPRIFNLVMLEPGKKFEKVTQVLGRGLRTADDKHSLDVYDICSNSGMSRSHATQRRKLFKEARQQLEIIEMEYD